MLRFQKFDPRRGEMVNLKPCLCSFGITEALIPIIATVAGSAGLSAATAGTIASIAAPALVDAGIGAGVSGLLGGNVGQGALLGGIGGAFGPALSAMGITSGGTGGGFLGNLFGGSMSPAASQAAQDIESGAANVGGGAGGAMAGAGALDAEGNPLSSYATGATGLNPAAGQAANAAAGAAGGIKTQPGTGGSIGRLGLANMVGLLGALSAQANRPASTTAPTPPGFSQPWNPSTSGALARTRNPFTPSTGSYYTYGQQAEPQFFNNNALNFAVPGGNQQASMAMAKGGALRHAMRNGHYGGGGHFSSGSGDHYVEGEGGGQDDNIDARLSPGEYVMDASTVSRLGDGNNEEGARRLDEMRHSIANDAGTNRVVQKKTRSPLEYLKKVA